MSRSFVTLEQHVCPVCGVTFDSGALLLDRQLRDTFEHHTVTGFEFCPEHAKLRDEGYIALVAIDEERSDNPPTAQNAWRLGAIMHIRDSVWPMSR